jgi:RNA polymerase sigma-70 factor (ECF subfamily)
MREKEQKRVFDEWMDNHKGVFFKITRAYAFNPYDRDDLFQEISIQVLNSIPKFRGDSSISTWIYRVALYSAMAWSRKEKKHLKRNTNLSEQEYLLTENAEASDDKLDWLYDQIGSLNEIDRSIMLLMLEGYSYKEIADVLGISENNVGVKISRIKRKLIHKSQNITNNGI